MYLVPILTSVIVVNEKNAKFLSTILLIWQRWKKIFLSDAWIIVKNKYSIFITRIIQSLANLRIQYSPLTWKYTTQICWLVLVPEH